VKISVYWRNALRTREDSPACSRMTSQSAEVIVSDKASSTKQHFEALAAPPLDEESTKVPAGRARCDLLRMFPLLILADRR